MPSARSPVPALARVLARRPLALALAAAVATVGLPAASPPAASAGTSSRPLQARLPRTGGHAAQSGANVVVSIDPFDPGRPVPRGYLGLSFEAAALGQLGAYAHRGNLVGLLRSLGPGILRFGGVTADQTVAWTDPATPPAPWAAATIGPAQMRAIAALARRSGWRVLLTVGLAHFEPTAAAREVAAAHAALGPLLAGVEIGNEPDAYGKHLFRPLPWIAQGYQEEVSAYREAIAALTPGVALAGPDVTGAGVFAEWGEEEALAQTPALLTGHHYPMGCAQTPPPSIEALLSPATREREARSLAAYMVVARAHGIPLRIDETNSVSCGGVSGISNTFAAALWAIGYVTQTMAGGAAGVNLQGNPANCGGYTPVCASDPAGLAAGRLTAQPDWYALLLLKALVGERPLPTTIAAEGAPNLVAAAFAARDRSQSVVLANDEPPGSPPLALRMSVGGGMGAARILRLTAAAPAATGGVLLAGRPVAANGSWSAPPRGETVSARGGVVSLELPAASAALVQVSRARLAPRRRHVAHRRRG